MTKKDEELLVKVREVELMHAEGRKDLEEALSLAEVKSSGETFLASSYKSKGKREKQEALFPQLQRELEEERKKLKEKTEVRWPDQESELREGYKDEIERQVAQHFACGENQLGARRRPALRR